MFTLVNDTFDIKAINQYVNGKKSTLYTVLIYNVTSYRIHGIFSQFSSVQLLSHVQLFVTPWAVAHQAFLSITNSQNLLKLMSIELVMPSNHLMLCRLLLLLPSIFTSIIFK